MMTQQKSHSTKKKILATLSLILLCVFLIFSFRSEIGAVFHSASHIIEGSDYSHVHSGDPETGNHLNQQMHDHEILSVFKLLVTADKGPDHTEKRPSVKIDVPVVGSGTNTAVCKPTYTEKLQVHLNFSFSTPLLDILTPPPKA